MWASHLRPRLEPHHLLLVTRFGEFSLYFGGGTSGNRSSPCPVSWQPGSPLGTTQAYHTPLVKNRQLQGKVARQKRKKTTEVSRIPGAGLIGPALEPALGRVPFPNAGDILKAACNNILMSREELVSQKSLKYDHM